MTRFLNTKLNHVIENEHIYYIYLTPNQYGVGIMLPLSHLFYELHDTMSPYNNIH